MANNQVIDEVLGVVLGDPDRHDQHIWIDGEPEEGVTRAEFMNLCGTTACVAGWASILTMPVTSRIRDEMVVDLYGHETRIEEYGQAALGLTRSQVQSIFWASEETAIARLKYVKDHPLVDGVELEHEVRETVPGSGW